MLIIRLLLIGLVFFLVSFGIRPALEYRNNGALFMLTIAAVIVVVIVLLRFVISLVRRTIFGKIITILIALAAVYFAVIQFFIISHGRPQDPEFPPADAVIILGAGLTYGTDRPTLALSYRLDKALEYLGAHPETPVIVSGGKGEIEIVSEAESMADYLISAGIDPDQITLEDNSTTTDENLLFSSSILSEHDYQTAAVVTSDFHCFRVELISKQHDINTTCIPAPNVWWLSPADHFREFLALTKAFTGL